MCTIHDWEHLLESADRDALAAAPISSAAPTPTTARPAGHPEHLSLSSGDGIGWVDLICKLIGHIPSDRCLIVAECWVCSRCGRHTRRVS